MFKSFVLIFSLCCSIWTGFLVNDLTKQKITLLPESVFSLQDGSVFIINNPKQFEWGRVPFSTIKSNEIKLKSLLPVLNNNFALYVSEKRPLILIQSKKNWDEVLLKKVFSEANIQIRKKNNNKWEIEEYDAEIKNKRLLLYKELPKYSKGTFNSSLIDTYSSCSRVLFSKEDYKIKDYYLRNGRLIEYKTTKNKKKIHKPVNDLEIFSGIIPNKAQDYCFHELSYLKNTDLTFSNSVISKYVKTGLISFILGKEKILVFDYEDNMEPLENLKEHFSMKNSNSSKAFFKNLPISEKLDLKKENIYLCAKNNFAFISSSSTAIDNVLTEISLSNTWRFNEKEMKKITMDMPKSVNFRSLKELTFGSISFIANKKLSTNVSLWTKQQYLNSDLNYSSFSSDDNIVDFITYDGPGNIVFLTNKEIVGIRGGKVLWKKALNGRIIGGIEKIPNSTSLKDYFKVTTTNQVHVLNLNGTYITNFLLKTNQSDYSGTGAFYRWNNKNYFATTTFSNKLLVYNHSGSLYKNITLPSFDDWNQIDVYAKSSTIYAAVYGAKKALVLNLDLLKVVDTINVMNSPKIINWRNGTRSIGIDSSIVKIVDENGSFKSLNVTASQIMGVYGNGTSALILVKDSNYIKLIDLTGAILLNKDFSNQTSNAISASYDINSNGEKFISFVDGVENNVYLYDGKNQLYPKRIMRGQKKVYLSHFSDKEIYLTTILDNKILQYIIEK
ncbi:MAG: hypothetical protein P8I93_07975 [Crocinitomicaceae bacterium]|nr:hypothetical protein [Crocinitomicaceae bacterium]